MEVENTTENTTEEKQPKAESLKDGQEEGKKKHRALRIVLAIVIAIVLILAIVLAAFGIYVNTGRDELLADNESGLSYKTMVHNGKKYAYNEDIVSIGLIGTDRLYGYVLSQESNGCADAVMVMAYNTATGKITLINVPRNTIVDFTLRFDDGVTRAKNSFLATAYAYGENDAEGAEYVCEAVSRLFGDIPIVNYVAILESAIDPLTEAMGGVTLTALEDVRGGLKKGETYTLTGNKALWYVQFRDPKIPSSPADRMARQHHFANAFLHQSLDAIKKDPSILGKFYDIVTDPQYMTTNLDTNELAYLAFSAVTKGVGDLELVTVPFDEDYDPVSELAGYIVREDELIDLLLEVYYEPVE